jgi:hypothetical protein
MGTLDAVIQVCASLLLRAKLTFEDQSVKIRSKVKSIRSLAVSCPCAELRITILTTKWGAQRSGQRFTRWPHSRRKESGGNALFCRETREQAGACEES